VAGPGATGGPILAAWPDRTRPVGGRRVDFAGMARPIAAGGRPGAAILAV